MRSAEARRNLDIDLLRGFSIALVLLSHARSGGAAYSAPLVPARLLNFLGYNGAMGVSVFFVISGYLITTIALRRDGEFGRVRIGRFYLLRALRILPPLLLLTALNLAGHAGGAAGFELGDISPARLLAAVYTFRFNLLYLNGASTLAAWAILWSLSIEEVFYLAFPLVSRALRTDWLFGGLLLAMIAQGPFYRAAHGWGALYSYLGCFDQLALGCLVAVISRRARAGSWAPGKLRLLRWSGFAAIVALCEVFDIHRPGVPIFLPTAVALGAAVYLLGSPLGGAHGPHLSRAELRDALRAPSAGDAKAHGGHALHLLALPGYLSYELYLYHPALLLLLRRPMAALFAATGGWLPRDLAVAVLIVVLSAVCLALHAGIFDPIQRHARLRLGLAAPPRPLTTSAS